MPDTTATFVYLASGSPRRRELLTQIGVSFRGLSVAVDETPGAGEAAADYVLRLARAKALAGAQLVAAGAAGAAPVLGADTTVVLDGRILGKPRDADDGRRMLLDLSGRSHEVLTAVALASAASAAAAPGAATVSRLSRSQVTFRVIAPEEAAAYWATAEPGDKAGGYAIQGRGAVFVSHLAGSFSGVMGLPLFETAALLDAAGVPRWGAP